VVIGAAVPNSEHSGAPGRWPRPGRRRSSLTSPGLTSPRCACCWAQGGGW